MSHPVVNGKFLEVGGVRFLVKGVSYGTFAPDATGALVPDADRVARDFDAIRQLGANTVRTYTPPPDSLLDEAACRGLRVMAGLPWPQHVAFLDSQQLGREIRSTVRREVRRLASHPATLLVAVGNEIPPSVVRWYGRRRIERFLRELFEEARAAAPEALLTYVNYPPTEYLDTSFFDVCAFNVFLHAKAELGAYVARLHHIAGARPVLIAEAGADSVRNGEERQASLVAMQLGAAFAEGACGAVAFSWTDEWWRGGRVVDDWAFGLVDAGRRPKPAYHAVRHVFGTAPFPENVRGTWPRVSVVVCAYDAADTIAECLEALAVLRYPDTQIIVVDDGSTDGTGVIAARYPHVRVIETANSGLAAARNVGLEHATGDIVAYTDADVRVDPDWLTYLVQPFMTSGVMAAGGPNVVPPDDSWFAQAVARAPGSPTHVLLNDRLAEHVPGCNCAFRREALVALGGFNPVFLRAGDDVDLCWRLQALGWTIGFAPAALVWHRHRRSVRAYLRQQSGYGEGETWLMRAHPDKFVRGHAVWRGHIYSPLPFIRSLSATRINAGPFGSAAFPSVYRTDAHPFAYMPHSGRWQIAWVLLFALAGFAAFGRAPYAPALAGAALMAAIATAGKCLVYGWRSDVARLPPIGRASRRLSRGVYRVTIAALHFLQPFARIHGRLRGLMRPPASNPSTHPRRRVVLPRPRLADVARGLRLYLGQNVEMSFWSERWIDVQAVLAAVADRLRCERGLTQVELDSGWWEHCDLTAVGRARSRLDVRVLVEDHGGGRCLHRFGLRSRVSAGAVLPWLLSLAAVPLLHEAGVLAWPRGAALVGLLALGTTLANAIAILRVVGHAVSSVATEFGMSPIDADPERRVPPQAAKYERAIDPLMPTRVALSTVPRVVTAVPVDLTRAADMRARETGGSRAFAGEL